MEPGEEDELVSGLETEESVVILGIEFEPGFGGVLVALTGGGVAVGESGADGADGVKGKRALIHTFYRSRWMRMPSFSLVHD
jgi:hypothetical protein